MLAGDARVFPPEQKYMRGGSFMHSIQLHATPRATCVQPTEPFLAPEVIAVQAARRRLYAQRLRTLDDLDAARRWARVADSRRGALDALSAGGRLERLDAALARLDDQLGGEVQA